MKRLTLHEFRELFRQIQEKNQDFDTFKDDCFALLYDNYYKLPLFYQDNFARDCQYDGLVIKSNLNIGYEYRNIYYADLTFSKVGWDLKWIDPIKSIGDTWLYQNNIRRDDIFLKRLANIITAIPEKLPPVPAYRAGEYYICTDGNRRIYAAYLLGREVQINCEANHLTMYDNNFKKL